MYTSTLFQTMDTNNTLEKEIRVHGHDIEKATSSDTSSPVYASFRGSKARVSRWQRVLTWGVEENGIVPVPCEERTDNRVVNLFTIWFTALLCLLP